MSEQRNISTKKVIRFSVGTLLVIIFMVALVAASRSQSNKAIKGLEVHLNDDKEYSFLQRKDIEALLLGNRHINLAQASVAQLDLELMERIARTNPWVANAEIYVDSRQVLQVNITQRDPVARIFDVNGASYYMDSTLHTMPVSAGYAYAAPVFTNVPVAKQDSTGKSLLQKIARLSEEISRDSFWQAQVTQVEVQPDHTFVLIPLMGDQRILLGDTARLQEKLDNLLAFYKNVSNKIGWDRYTVLDARFKGQVVASPSMGWIPPRVTDTTPVAMDVPTTAPGADVKPDIAAVPAAAVTHAVKPAATQVKPQAATAHAVKPAATTHAIKPAVAATVKPRTVSKPASAKVSPAKASQVAKAKPALQAAAKTKEKKKETKDNHKNPQTQTPKYIYPGKHSGNR
ncbi:cell division protein FtsQ/DivIB [Taibaiella helva]|uniref:cell division protein FtsQ/DivIB n=1 Tax=Taibaiella helva TaxID=2301235 RepID=UPI000E5860A6|nr:cell division protein FtsQ/DivIB [Taibaiella helva]